MATITVLSPVGEPRRATLALPALPGSLRGMTVGFLDNTKANFDRLVREMGAILVDELGVEAVVHRRKANASTPAPEAMLEELAKHCGLVLAGSAD
jgi:hypothetical protein